MNIQEENPVEEEISIKEKYHRLNKDFPSSSLKSKV